MNQILTAPLGEQGQVKELSAAAKPDLSNVNLAPKRHWQASLDIVFKARADKTVIAKAAHNGPLRVQRPFYPERDGTCHVYLLHPPGGLVIGDDLSLSASLPKQSQALLTTPSAGRVYNAKGLPDEQVQRIQLAVDDQATLEWLPQETIVYEGANARLETKVNLTGEAKLFAWDIVRLGRRASGENFDRGSCVQNLEVHRDGRPLFIERNRFISQDALLQASWGLQGASSCGTLFATMQISRDTIDDWVEKLNALSSLDKYGEKGSNLWGLTQKKEFFIARFMGNSITLCRDGFQLLWQLARPEFIEKDAVIPRIWFT